MRLGEIMREARQRAGLSQYDLSWTAKVSRPQVIGIEKGTVMPRLDTLMKLCIALNLEIMIREQSCEPSPRPARRRHRGRKEPLEEIVEGSGRPAAEQHDQPRLPGDQHSDAVAG
jgi:transcriptional regulator with XRE-family HTH domain